MMIPYFLLLFVPFLFNLVSIVEDERKNKHIRVNLKIGNNKDSLALPIFFILLLFLLALRSIEVGRDLPNYYIIWQRDASQSLIDIIQEWNDPLFKLYNFITYRLTNDFQLYLSLTAIITIIPIAVFYCKDREHSILKMAIFVNMSTFFMMFSGIRQAISISLGVVCFELIKRKKNIAFVIVALFASLIHVSGFVVFALYPLYHVRFKRKHLFVFIPIIVALFVFNKQVFLMLSILFTSVYDGSIEITTTGALGSLILFVIFAVLSYVITDESQIEGEFMSLRNILLAAVCIQTFASLHPLAMRMNYYFIIFIPVAVGKCFSFISKRNKKVAFAIEVAMCVFFVGYFCYNTYKSYVTGISALDTIPYIPFWAD